MDVFDYSSEGNTMERDEESGGGGEIILEETPISLTFPKGLEDIVLHQIWEPVELWKL